MTRLEHAVRQKQWELVWLYLFLGVSRAAAALPSDSVAELLDLLGDEPGGKTEERDGGGE